MFKLTAFVLAMTSMSAMASETLSCVSGPSSADIGPATISRAAQSLNVAALTQTENGQALICVNEKNAAASTLIGVIGALAIDTKLVGMDYRPLDGKLYAVGDKGGIYTINTANAAIEYVNRLSVDLDGKTFGVDFNPVVDRLRIVSDTGQNLRHNPNSGGTTINDTKLNTGVSPAAGVPAAPVLGVASAAYTNNDQQTSTATTLFVINSATDVTSIQSPANAGIVVNTGSLGVNAVGPVGFDIYSTLRNGATTGNRALASFGADGQNAVGLYSINLLTGTASAVSKFAPGVNVVDIAIPLNQRVDD